MPAAGQRTVPAARQTGSTLWIGKHEPMNDDDFQVVTFVDRDQAVVMLCGDVDASTCATFRAAAQAAAETADHVMFDVAGVTFMDTSALSVILETLEWVAPACGTVVICSARQPVLRLLEITGFDKLLTGAPWRQHHLVHRICCDRPRRLGGSAGGRRRAHDQLYPFQSSCRRRADG